MFNPRANVGRNTFHVVNQKTTGAVKKGGGSTRGALSCLAGKKPSGVYVFPPKKPWKAGKPRPNTLLGLYPSSHPPPLTAACSTPLTAACSSPVSSAERLRRHRLTACKHKSRISSNRSSNSKRSRSRSSDSSSSRISTLSGDAPIFVDCLDESIDGGAFDASRSFWDRNSPPSPSSSSSSSSAPTTAASRSKPVSHSSGSHVPSIVTSASPSTRSESVARARVGKVFTSRAMGLTTAEKQPHEPSSSSSDPPFANPVSYGYNAAQGQVGEII